MLKVNIQYEYFESDKLQNKEAALLFRQPPVKYQILGLFFAKSFIKATSFSTPS